MPIWLRKWTLAQIAEHYEKEAAALSGKKVPSTNPTEHPVIQRPAIKTPDFVVKNRKPGR